jgi:hypothetical protein
MVKKKKAEEKPEGAEKEKKAENWPQRAFFVQCVDDYCAKHGITREEMAALLGYKKSSLDSLLYQTGISKIGYPGALRAAEFFGCSVTKFLDDPGGTPYDDSDAYPVPKFKLHLCAGNGNVVYEDEEVCSETYFVDNARIRKLNVNPKHLRYFDVEGDSMYPDYMNGDRVLVNLCGLESGFKPGPWMLRVGNTVAVKNIQQIGGNQYQASSKNPAYPPFLLDETCELLGRVVSMERDNTL